MSDRRGEGRGGAAALALARGILPGMAEDEKGGAFAEVARIAKEILDDAANARDVTVHSWPRDGGMVRTVVVIQGVGFCRTVSTDREKFDDVVERARPKHLRRVK